MDMSIILVYNLEVMRSKSSPELSEVERDPLFFTWLMTLVFGIVYYWTLVENPAIRQPTQLIIFTTLMVVHVALHWLIGIVMGKPKVIFWYIILQGALVFIICWMGQQLPLIFALYLAILGLAIGMLGVSRQVLLVSIYYLLLAFINFQHLEDSASAGKELLSLAPLILFSLTFVILFRRQADARQQAQSLATKLDTANKLLAEYAAQVEELTLATERQRMARELHDTLSQGVAGLVLQLEAVKAHLEAGREARAAAIIDQSLARARNTLTDSRSAIDDLRAIPASLPEALRAKAERFTQATGIPCELSLVLGDTVPSPQTGDHLLSVLSEALVNITRHAQASRVWVKLEAKNNHVELEIRDNGQGFHPEIETGGGHYGLLGMRERARLVGGSMEIESGTGQGTRIRLIVPIPQET
jgi:two-component system, NarL family, sensor histidine kinase YdfH